MVYTFCQRMILFLFFFWFWVQLTVSSFRCFRLRHGSREIKIMPHVWKCTMHGMNHHASSQHPWAFDASRRSLDLRPLIFLNLFSPYFDSTSGVCLQIQIDCLDSDSEFSMSQIQILYFRFRCRFKFRSMVSRVKIRQTRHALIQLMFAQGCNTHTHAPHCRRRCKLSWRVSPEMMQGSSDLFGWLCI